jgi:hypothetical protein
LEPDQEPLSPPPVEYVPLTLFPLIVPFHEMLTMPPQDSPCPPPLTELPETVPLSGTVPQLSVPVPVQEQSSFTFIVQLPEELWPAQSEPEPENPPLQLPA